MGQMTLEQVEREHFRIYCAFLALADAASSAHPCIPHDDNRRALGNALAEAWRTIENTHLLIPPPLPANPSAGASTVNNGSQSPNVDGPGGKALS